jgi:hypothetical protein
MEQSLAAAGFTSIDRVAIFHFSKGRANDAVDAATRVMTALGQPAGEKCEGFRAEQRDGDSELSHWRS